MDKLKDQGLRYSRKATVIKPSSLYDKNCGLIETSLNPSQSSSWLMHPLEIFTKPQLLTQKSELQFRFFLCAESYWILDSWWYPITSPLQHYLPTQCDFSPSGSPWLPTSKAELKFRFFLYNETPAHWSLNSKRYLIPFSIAVYQNSLFCNPHQVPIPSYEKPELSSVFPVYWISYVLYCIKVLIPDDIWVSSSS